MTKENDECKLDQTKIANIFARMCMTDEMLNPLATGRQRAILLHLYTSVDDADRTNEAIAAVMDITKPSTIVYRQVTRLVEAGLVKRYRSPKRRQVMILDLTEQGRRYVEEEYLEPLKDIIEQTRDI